MDILEKIALTKIKGVGPKISRLLLNYCGSAESVFNSSRKQLLSIPGIGAQIVDTILSKTYLKEAEAELAFVEKHKIELLWLDDANYPKRLRHCDDAPLLLYFKGKGNLNPKRTVSIVGSRNATSYGRRICEQFVQDLQACDVQIVSGLATA